MRFQFNPSLLLTLSLLLGIIGPGNAQTIVTNPETLYDSIRVIALDGRFTQAEVMARDLVDENRDYGDAIVLLARIVAWQERYSEAIEILDSLLVWQPEHDDARVARETIMEWMDADNLRAGEELMGVAEVEVPEVPEVPQISEVPEALELPEASESSVSDSLARGVDLYMGYSFDTFEEPYQRYWQIFSMGARYETGRGPVMGTVNFGNLQANLPAGRQTTGIQLQAEYWPKIGKKDYAWIAWAYSPFSYFPQHRVSAEYWHSLSKGWVVSAGASYYYFDQNIFIPAFSVEKYIGKYWFSGKTYIHLKDAGTTASLFLTARRYINDFDYLQLSVGAGTAPDEPYDIAADLERQSAVAIKAAINKKINNRFTFKAGVGYSREEYIESLKRNRFEGFVTLIYSPVAK